MQPVGDLVLPCNTFRMLVTLTFYHAIPTFNQLGVKSHLKTIREKEKIMLVNSIFSHNVFNPIKVKNHHVKYVGFVVCKCFQFGPV